VIGDFGCGEGKFAEAMSEKNVVYSFDHIAINESVVSCDMVNVPLEDECLDVAIFSLSLMGANFSDYLQEAYRTLKLDGDLHIIEATSRFSDRNKFIDGLKRMGFAVVSMEDKWKFTHIRALKGDARPELEFKLRF